MSFIDNSTPWGKKRQKINLKLHRRASIITKDETGKEIEMGYKSEIMGITLGNNPGKSRGIAGRLILWEESGENRHLVDAWNIARQSVEEYGHGFGQMIAFGTSSAGNISFEGLRAMFYNPAAYGCIEFPDIWEGVPTDRTCGLFVPA
jgi:hypothetical protein